LYPRNFAQNKHPAFGPSWSSAEENGAILAIAAGAPDFLIDGRRKIAELWRMQLHISRSSKKARLQMVDRKKRRH
jgi:hypothetical protein